MLARTSEGNAQRETRFRLKGYEAWQVGRVRCGTRAGAAIIQLSGDLAATHFDTLRPIADTISRLDIAVTARLAERDDELGLRTYTQASRWYEGHNHAARPEAHQDADGGYTCYVGARTSDWHLRVYNKEAESRDDPAQAEHYARCWRYELECKGPTVAVLAGEIAAHDGDDRARDIQSMVHEYVSHHGMTPVFPHSGGATLVKGFRRRSDRQSRLDWLERSVKPAVNWLSQTGDIADIYAALGLHPGDPTASPRVNPVTGEILE
jgi:DNA relaxase NicK